MNKDLLKRKIAGVFLITLVGILIIIASIAVIYSTHKNAIVNQAKEQVITTAETASRGLETFFLDKRKNMDLYFNGILNYMENQDMLKNQMENILRVYYETENTYLQQVVYLTEEEFKRKEKFIEIRQKSVFGSYEYKEDGIFILNMYKPLYLSGYLSGYVMACINLNAVYDDILYPIQIGKNGYCTVKDRSGMILMHGVESQIGINSKTDRKKKYPDLNPEGIDRLVENQISGVSGTELVKSYWWDKVEDGKVKKIIGYTPVNVMEDFWVISVIMDYDQIEEPLHQTLTMSILVGFLLMLFFGFLVFYITRDLKNKQQMQMEWKYERKLYESESKLEKQEERAEQYDRLQTMGILMGTIAHEFNNLMTPITIYCDLLASRFAKDEDSAEEIAEISSAALGCSELSKQILAYVRKETQEERMLPFDGAAAAKTSMKMIEKIIPGNIKLNYQISSKPIFLLGNPGALNQILLNLCTNAYQAMKEEGGRLEVIFQHIENGEAELKIKDNGCGMEEETLKNIYDAFYTTKAPGEGTGLGLAVVQRLVSRHKGKIQVESTPGKGTAFTIIFPVLERKKLNKSKKDTVYEEVINKKLKVMLIDDKPEVLRALKKGLNITNWKLECFTNALPALEKFKKNPEKFDIILTDLSIPDMNGFELAAFMKKRNPAIKIIVMTGCLEKDINEYIGKNIIDAYILKPLNIKDIIEKAAEFSLPGSNCI